MDNQIKQLEEELKTVDAEIEAKKARKKELEKALKALYIQSNRMKEVLAKVNADKAD